MDKKIRFEGCFTLEEINMVVEKLNENLTEDVALINEDYSLSVAITIMKEEILVSKVLVI